jgi:hypothetical protein
MTKKSKYEKDYEKTIEGKFKKIREAAKGRDRCPRDGRILDKNGRCWLCGWGEEDDIETDN